MSFVPTSFLDLIPAMTRETADAQEFGVVQVDDAGVVLLYNRWESAMANVPVANAEGRNFFTQVAPCTNNRLVYDRFRDGIARGQLDTEFSYTFTYRMRPTNVLIRMLRHPATRTNWVLVTLQSD
jgi:photoactive yellow protein